MTGPLNDPRAVDLSDLAAAAEITGATPEKLAEKAADPELSVERWGSVWSIGADGHVYRDGAPVDEKTEVEMLDVLKSAIADMKAVKATRPAAATPARPAKPVSRIPSAEEIRQDRRDAARAARAAARARKQKRRAQRQARKGTR